MPSLLESFFVAVGSDVDDDDAVTLLATAGLNVAGVALTAVFVPPLPLPDAEADADPDPTP